MCGRYALALPPSRIRQHLDDSNMPSQDAPDDDYVRQSYNFSPGYYGLVYRADAPDHGAGRFSQHEPSSTDGQEESGSHGSADLQTGHGGDKHVGLETKQGSGSDSLPKPEYKLQAMKWGLIPFWTKRNPDFGTLMRTINCRDDSLSSPGGMWHTMKQSKRCIVVAQGFFEWLKKNEGKDKIPHYIKRKDGKLMCFAGLWDCVKYEGAEEKTYTYTIITTDANKQMSFLHDRMPVILDTGSEDIFTWLDTNRSEWNRELQGLLKPYEGELEIYPVTKDMNKTGTSSPKYIIPIYSSENKQNIANFFGSPKKAVQKAKESQSALKTLDESDPGTKMLSSTEDDHVVRDENSETNAPLPVAGSKREIAESNEQEEQGDNTCAPTSPSLASKSRKTHAKQSSPSKNMNPVSSKRSKSAISNATVSKLSPTKPTGDNKKITSFFGK